MPRVALPSLASLSNVTGGAFAPPTSEGMAMIEACFSVDVCLFSEAMNDIVQMCQGEESILYDQKSNVLCLNGRVDEETFADVFDIDMTPNVRVHMTSPGGELSYAVRITEHLESYGYDFYVSGICASACAQFIALGANSKYILGKGIIAMHGGPMARSQYEEGRSEADISNIDRQMNEFRAFYARRSIDIELTRTPPPTVQEQLAEGLVVFWQPTPEQFYRYGVEGMNYHLSNPNTIQFIRRVGADIFPERELLHEEK